MKDLNLYTTVEGGEVIFRQGEALPVKEPTKIDFTGEMPSVSRYLAIHGVDGKLNKPYVPLVIGEGNENYVHPEKAIITVNRAARSIELLTDCKSPYSHKITGKLELSDEIKQFNINPSGKTQTREELVKLLRFNKRFFADKAKHAEILAAYQKFNVTTSGGLKVESDNRGNKDLGYQNRVTTDLPEAFFLDIPVFKGYAPVKFMVEICLDVSAAEARFWLESPELAEVIETQAKTLIEDEIKLIGDKYVVVYQ